MRDLKFILSAAAILLAGALAAGLTAHAVVSPKTGEVRSAGVVAIPTVLGQTAEEVLFYPWSMYDTQPLRRLTEDELLYSLGLDALGDTMEDISRVLSEADGVNDVGHGTILPIFTNFGLIMPISIQWNGLIAALEWNLDEDGEAPAAGTQIFLKDFPALAGLEDQVPVTLSFAASDTGLSFLICSAQAGTPAGGERTGAPDRGDPGPQAGAFSEEERAAALELVANDLLALFSPGYIYAEERDPGGAEEGPPADDGAADPPGLALYRLIRTFFDYNADLGLGSLKPIGEFLFDRAWMASMVGIAPETYGPDSIDEFLSAIETATGWNIQLITTQRQILALFTQPGGAVFGVYYDIGLGRYSGIGVSQ